MKNVFKIISKNIKVLLRSKGSALIIILAPLLVILMVGVAFDNSGAFGLTIGVHAPNDNAHTQQFVSALSQKEFTVIDYDTQEKCVEDIKLGLTTTCVIFPSDFSFDTNEKQDVDFYVDQSKINLVYMVMDTLEGEVGGQSDLVSKDLTNALLDTLKNARDQLSAQQTTLAEVKNSQENARTTMQALRNNLGSTNIIFPTDQVKVDKTVYTLDVAKTSLSGALKAARKNATEARDETEASGASTEEKDDITKFINRASTSITKSESIVKDGNESLDAISILLYGMQTELGALETRLDDASGVIVDGQNKLSSTSLSLSSASEQITGTQTTLASLVSAIDEISVTNPDTIASPVSTNIKPVAAQSTYLNYLFPSLMILVIMFIAILLGTTLVMMDKHSPAYFRNSITPTRNITFVISTYLTTLLLVVLQLVIIVAIASIFFSAQILPVLPTAALILIVAATFFSLVGMAVGYAFSSEETGTLAAISVGSIFLFMSNVIIPLESMPLSVRSVAAYNPFVIAERALRSSILFKPSLEALSTDLFFLLGGSLVLFLSIWGGQYVLSKHPLERRVSFQRGRRKPKASKVDKVTKVNSTPRQSPHDYLEQMIKKGFSQQEILKAFQKAGYGNREIRKVVAAYKKKKRK